jgi:DNA polymerase-3 subunit delta'
MIDLASLLYKTPAYRTFLGDKENGRLSHAYLIVSHDQQFLGEYLKLFALTAVCDNAKPCLECRACKLVLAGAHPDVIFYPQKEGAVLAEDVNSLIEQSYVKPLESKKKIFVINNADTMNVSAQNKLLKTLEEPPQGVHILLGANSEFPLLATVKSRVRKLDISNFNDSELAAALSADCPDTEKLKRAIACGDGSVGKALSLYGDENLKAVTDYAFSVLADMQSSKDLLKFSTAFSALKVDVSEFLSVLELLLRDLMVIHNGRADLVNNSDLLNRLKTIKGFCGGSIIHALECVNQAYKRKKFNANATMLVEWLLFQILEGKYKWQKL